MHPHIVTAAPVLTGAIKTAPVSTNEDKFAEGKITDYLEMGANITDETVRTPNGTIIRRRRVEI